MDLVLCSFFDRSPATVLPADVLSFSRVLDREVFESELSSASVEWATAANARYSAVRGTTGSDPDNFVYRPAMGAVKRYLLSFRHGQCAEFPRNGCGPCGPVLSFGTRGVTARPEPRWATQTPLDGLL